MSDGIVLQAEKVTKVYPGTVALNNVDFKVYEGKVNILVGENGAGKSTLMKIIAGAEMPTSGSLRMNDDLLKLRDPLEAQAHGIGIIYQEMDLCPNMTVSDNVFLTHELAPRTIINFRKQKAITREILHRLEHDIDPDRLVGDLGVSSQQIVAIAKALLQNVKILIMDEPTSALTVHEVNVLFRVIRELKSQGVSIIYISHRLEEVLQIGDWITVLRDGQVQAEERLGSIDIRWIVEQMVGKTLSDFLPRVEHHTKREVLQVKGLTYPRPEGGFHVDDLSFQVNAGEIVGLYGLMGAGRSELFECLMGLHPESSGEIVVDGKTITQPSTIDRRIESGLVLIPEDRQAAGIVKTMSVGDNIILANIRNYAKFGLLSRRPGLKNVLEMIRDLSIKTSSPEQQITALSGGNQQKVVVAKALLTKPKILLMDEPTRGIDVNAKSEIFSLMNELAQSGLGILFASSELKEITALSDRVLVMARGKLTGEFTRGAYDENDLVGASAKDRSMTDSKKTNNKD